jgi:hypothetical protein
MILFSRMASRLLTASSGLGVKERHWVARAERDGAALKPQS